MFDRILADAHRPSGRPLEEVINETLFHEKRRLDRQQGRNEERHFYQQIREQLGKMSERKAGRALREIIDRYAEEISGHFDPRIYRLATTVMPFGLTTLLNGISPGRLFRPEGRLRSFAEMVELRGETETVKKLIEKGTVVLVPTHSSNLDSIILGAGIYNLGLPPFTYGAGLNLFENPIIGYFMQNLGAYTVDRLKTDPLYRDTLKEYSTVILEYGRESLFFPGGTRSRSGAIERHLKKGLLGTTIPAYRNNLMRGRDDRIFIVPCTLNYPLVLEASTLIDDFLQISGRSRYIIVDDEFSEIDKWLAYARGLFALDMHIYIRFGRPLDPFGNLVTDEGESIDPQGNIIDPSGYLRVDGEVVRDDARDAEYTRGLSESIVDSYLANNMVCATHVVCHAVIDMLLDRFEGKDLYRFLRTLGPEISVRRRELDAVVHRLLAQLGNLQRNGKIELGEIVSSLNSERVIDHALKRLGAYHKRPVLKQRGTRVHIEDGNLAFYYRNRIEGYGLLDRSPLFDL
jgi:glycerol-3-phosphate O-acyltransferase